MKASLIVLALMLAQNLAAQSGSRAKLFVERRCTECHAITALNLKAQADVAPDLTYADVDVPVRYAMSLERFLDGPVGPMRLVLAGHVRLNQTDTDSIVATLRRLNFERLGELDIIPRKTARNRAGRGT